MLRYATSILVALAVSRSADAQGDVGYAGPQIERTTNLKPYSLAFFRVNEFGARMHDDRITAITDEVARLRQLTASKDIFTVVYVHGWQHDASPTDSNVIHFRELLDSLGRGDSHARTRAGNRPVLGVYVSWPAKSPWGPPSFWSKRNVADRVERTGEISKLLTHLNETVKGGSSGRASRLVFIGHSFGARLLFNSAAEVMRDNIVKQGSARPDDRHCVGNTVCRPVAGFGDLVVLVNPAFEARMYATFSLFSPRRTDDARLLRDPGENWDALQPPLLLAVGAVDDDATQTWWKRALAADPDSLTKVTLTNHIAYVTHRLVPSDASLACKDRPCACPSTSSGVRDDSAQVRDVYRRYVESSPFGCVKLVPLSPQAQSNSPFVVARADSRIIAGHGGIWGQAFQQFLLEYIEAANRLPRPYYRQQDGQ